MKKNGKQIKIKKRRLILAALFLLIAAGFFCQALFYAEAMVWGPFDSMEKGVYITGAIAFVFFYSYVIDYVCVHIQDKKRRNRILLSVKGNLCPSPCRNHRTGSHA